MRYYDPEINILSDLYDLLSAVEGDFPEKDFSAYTKKQKRSLTENLISFTEENSDALSPEMKELIYPYPELSFDKLREILKSANEKYIDSMRKRRDEWLEFAERFDTMTKEALFRFIDGRMFFDLILSKSGKMGEIILTNEYTSSYRQTVYLVDSVLSDNVNMGCIGATDAEIEIFENGYRVSCVQENAIVTVDFSDIRLETQFIDYSDVRAWIGSPWRQISESLSAIEYKKDFLGLEFLNEKEKAILPLCRFDPIHYFEIRYKSVSGDKAADQLFIDFAERIGNNSIIKLTQQYSCVLFDKEAPPSAKFKQKQKALRALYKEMAKPSSEALARLILTEIKDAAAGYPTDVELDIAPKELADARKTVTDMLKRRGYEGEYPHFKKMTHLKGLKLLEVQEQPEFFWNEKHTACMIDCFESSIDIGDDEKPDIYFAVSTVFLKKDELHLYDSLDGRSGFFPHKNRRRARTIGPMFYFQDNYIWSYVLERDVILAAKTAECEKLTKEERKSLVKGRSFLFDVIMFLFTGLLFGFIMCLKMFLICLLFDAPSEVFSSGIAFSEFVRVLIVDIPWLRLFLFCAVGFGLPMTVLTALSKRRG